jgi:PAS domain S-box-containing protein
MPAYDIQANNRPLSDRSSQEGQAGTMDTPQKKLLLVEDEAVILLERTRFLEANGYAVTGAASAKQALAALAADPAIDLVLMDIDLGRGPSGIDTATKMLGSRELPIVFLSSHSGRETVEQARRITRYGYVTKDSGDHVLLASIETALELFATLSRAKANEAALETQSAYLKAIFDSINDAVFVDDADTGQIIDVNETTCRMYGYSRAELLAGDIGNLSSGELGYTQHDALVRLDKARNEGPQTFEWQARHRDGRIFWVEVFIRFVKLAGEPRFIVTARDIDGRKKAEARETEGREKYFQLFELGLEAVFLIDVESGAILEANSAATAMYRYSKEALLSKRNVDLSAEPEATRQATVSDPPAGEVLIPLRWHRRSNGERFPVEIFARFFRRQGRLVHVAAIRDISGRIEQDAAIKKLVEEKTLLLREVHHRIKNNLTTIAALLRMQAAGLAGPAASALLEAQARVHTMADIYDRLYRTGDYRFVSVRAHLQALADGLARAYAPEDKPRIVCRLGDPVLDQAKIFPLGIIVTELTTNALKYAFPADTDGEIRIELEATDSGRLRLRVADNGTGFAPSADEGGFGLNLVRILASQLEGEIRRLPEPGTVWELEFPP